MADRLMLDVKLKYTVLLIMTIVIALVLFMDKDINFPDWLVVIYTMVFQYFFRRSPKEPNGSSK